MGLSFDDIAGMSLFGDDVLDLVRGQQKDVTTTTGPHPMFQPFIQEGLTGAQNLYRSADPTYANLYAGLNPLQQQGITELGGFNPAATNSASGYIQSVLGGDYLNANPWLDQAFGRGADALQGRLGSQFAASGRNVGPGAGGAFQGATAQGLSGLAGDIYGGNYQAERQRMMQAAGLAPGLDQASMGGALARLQAGGMQQGDEMARLAEANREANFGYESGWDELSRYLGLVNPTSAPYSASTSPIFRNPMAGAAGGALAGAQIGGPWGALIGGGLGLLGGG